MDNPFEFGRELGVDELVDRTTEVSEVVDTVRHGGKLFIIGPRRYGKTSILKAAEDRLRAQGAVVLRYDAESYASLDQLVAAIITDATTRLTGSVERVGDQIRKFFARLRPELNFSVTEREWTARLGVAVADTGPAGLGILVDALNGIEELAKAQPKTRPVGLLIDEFQKICGNRRSYRWKVALIRATIQQHKRTGYIFAGSKTRLLTAMTMDAARPFYRLGHLRFVGAVPRSEFSDFLRTKFTESKFTIENSAVIDSILDLAEEVPYNVQMLAHACWEDLRGTAPKRSLSEAMVRQSLERLVRQYDPFTPNSGTD